MWAVVASAIVFCSLHFGAEEMSGGIGTSGIYVKVFEKVAHFDPIGGFVKLAAIAGSITSDKISTV